MFGVGCCFGGLLYFVVRCLLIDVCCLVRVGSLFVVVCYVVNVCYCALCVDGCLLCVVCCVLFVVYCTCLLYGVGFLGR